MTMLHSETPAAKRTFANLPPFPAVALKILQSMARSDVSMMELSELIGSDAAFSAEVLMIANSPLCGFRREIHGVLQATTLFGLERLRGLAVTAHASLHAELGNSTRFARMLAA